MLLYLLATQPPPDFLHDPFGQFIINVTVAILVGIVTALVAIWVFRKQRSKKEISYQIISSAPIASVSKGLENRVTIQLDGHSVKDARQVVLKLRNSGNAAVKRADYEEPIRFIFEGSEIIGSAILSTEPENLTNSIDKNTFITLQRQPLVVTQGGLDDILLESAAQLEKFLLNPKQSVTLTFLMDRAYQMLEVRGRIVDGEITKYVERVSLPRLFVFKLNLVLNVVSLLIVAIGYLLSSTIILSVGIIMSLILIATLVLTYAPAFFVRRY